MKKALLVIRPALKNAGLLIFSLLAFLQPEIYAQNIDFDDPCPNAPAPLTNQVAGQVVTGIPNITAVHPPNGEPFTLSIPTIDVTLGGFSTGEGCSPCSSGTNIVGLIFTITGSDFTISGTPASTAAGRQFSVTLTATPTTGSSCSRTYTFDITRKPVDLMLVLDKSGSMSANVTGSATSRWNALKDGVDLFLGVYQPKLLPTGGSDGDQMGIRMFSGTDAAPVNAPFNVNSFIPVTPASILSSILGGDSPGGSTAMGSGLLTATSFLFPGGADNGHKKAILVFTDGEQNVPPDVVAAPGLNPTVSGTDITHADQIQIHAIGLGVAGAATQTLYNMAHESGVAPEIGITNIANNLSTTPPDLNLTSYLTNIKNQLLSGASPQYVDVRRHNFKALGEGFGAEETFTVSNRIDQVFINFITSVTNEARISRLEKDGQVINLFDSSYIKIKRGNNWQTLIISVLGIEKKVPGFTSGGNWKITVVTGSQTPAPYILSFTVDDHHSKMRGTTTQTKELIVGNTLPLAVDFTKYGNPVSGATAMAVIAKPGEDLGDLLARTKIDVKIDTSADADNPGTQKLLELIKDSTFLQKMLDSNHVVALAFDAGQNKYTGEFSQLDVSGVYQVAYIISVNDTALGEIKRYAEESIYVRFPEVDLPSSEINLTATQGGGTLIFRPIAKNGKFIGPGWGNAIKIDGNETKVTRVVDNLDGSYTLTIQGSLTDNVTISIGTAEIFKGKLEDFGQTSGDGNAIWKQWWFWLILVALILIIILLFARKKKSP